MFGVHFSIFEKIIILIVFCLSDKYEKYQRFYYLRFYYVIAAKYSSTSQLAV